MFGLAFEKIGLLRESIAATIVLVLLVPLAFGQNGTAVTLDKIMEAWQARQDRVKTGTINWKEKLTEPKGSISSSMPRIVRRRLQLKDGAIIPPSDATIEFTISVHLEGEKVRYTYEGEQWAHESKGYRKVRYTSVYDGTQAKDLYSDGVGYATWPIGVIRNGSQFRDAQMFRVRPVLFAFRPLVPALRPFDIRSSVVSPGRALVNGSSCVELVRRVPGTNSSIRLFLDPTRDFVIVRQLIADRGQVVNQIDIQYRSVDGVGWSPSNWTIANHLTNGKLLDAAQCTVTFSEFNIEMDPNLFTLSFPPGSRVQDERRREDWVIKHNGEKRPIVPEDRGATHEQLINSDPGEAFGVKMKPFFLTLPGLVTLCTGLTALIVFIWRRRLWCRRMLRLGLF